MNRDNFTSSGNRQFRKRLWLKWLLLVVVGVALLALALFGLFMLLVFWGLSQPGFSLPPAQDCPGVSITISGQVADQKNQPIPGAQVHFTEQPIGDNLSTVEFVTDAQGHFALDESVHVFLCNDLIFNGVADGYEKGSTSYSLARDYVDSLPPQPISVHVTVVLQRIDNPPPYVP